LNKRKLERLPKHLNPSLLTSTSTGTNKCPVTLKNLSRYNVAYETVLGDFLAGVVALAIQLGSNGKLLRARNQCDCQAPWSSHP
jgi:hypothetical protein